MAESEGERLGKGSAADLLAAWRAAERDHAAAIETASATSLAMVAAGRASEAARETAEAARLSLEAAQRADRAARETADAADVLSATLGRDHAAADAALGDALAAESNAKDAFNAARKLGFPKDAKSPENGA
jgi:hypothetical protein